MFAKAGPHMHSSALHITMTEVSVVRIVRKAGMVAGSIVAHPEAPSRDTPAGFYGPAGSPKEQGLLTNAAAVPKSPLPGEARQAVVARYSGDIA